MTEPAPISGRLRWSWYGGLLLLVFLFGLFPVVNGDIWWHLRTGQLILERWTVPHTDWFTYTNPDAPWTDLHWGFQVEAALLWTMGGATALVLFKCLVGAGVFALGLSTSDDETPPWCIVLAWIAPAVIFSGRYYVRPEMASLLLTAAFVAVLHTSWNRPRLLWLLPVLQMIWVNHQGLFVLGGILLGCYWCEWIRRYIGTDPTQRNSFAIPFPMLGLVTIATGISTLVNPYGFRGALFPLQLFAKVRGEDREFYFQFSGELSGLREFVNEHPLGVLGLLTNWSSGLLVLMFVLLVVTLLALAARRQVNLFHWLLVIAFGYLTWQMRRNSVLFAIVGGYVLQQNIQVLWQVSREKGKATTSKWPQVFVAAMIALLVVSIPTGLYHKLRPSFPPRHFGLGVTNVYPHAAARFLAQPGMPKRIYAVNEGAAAVCIFHLGPTQRVFADARLETNTKKTLQAYQDILIQLAADYSAVGENLRMGPESNDPELPALVIDSFSLISYSQSLPRLLAGLLEGKKNQWQCVYCPFTEQDIPDSDALPVSPKVVLGACVFLDRNKAQQLKLPDHSKVLKKLLLRIRRSR